MQKIARFLLCCNSSVWEWPHAVLTGALFQYLFIFSIVCVYHPVRTSTLRYVVPKNFCMLVFIDWTPRPRVFNIWISKKINWSLFKTSCFAKHHQYESRRQTFDCLVQTCSLVWCKPITSQNKASVLLKCTTASGKVLALQCSRTRGEIFHMSPKLTSWSLRAGEGVSTLHVHKYWWACFAAEF